MTKTRPLFKRVLDVVALALVGFAAVGMSLGVFRDQHLVARLLEIVLAVALNAWLVTLVVQVRFLWTTNRVAKATAN